MRPRKNLYVLTDPAIHHRSLSRFYFTSTSHGSPGIAAFKAQHRCNRFCRELGLPDPALL